MKDEKFIDPHFGKQISIEQFGREVRLTFFSSTEKQADNLVKALASQLRTGALNITLKTGKPPVEKRIIGGDNG